MFQSLGFENLMVDSRNITQQQAQFYADCAGTPNHSVQRSMTSYVTMTSYPL